MNDLLQKPCSHFNTGQLNCVVNKNIFTFYSTDGQIITDYSELWIILFFQKIALVYSYISTLNLNSVFTVVVREH